MSDMEQLHGFVDLHTHSSASDGTDSPSELVKHAAEAGLDAVALTDHDTVSGIHEFMNAAKTLSIRAVPGVELSTKSRGKEIHIIGLFIDPDCEVMTRFLAARQEDRIRRNKEVILKLRNAGYDITEEEVRQFAHGESAGRPHIAQVLIAKGYFRDLPEVFVKCLRRGASCYVPRTTVTPAEAVHVIRQAGGLAVWAHPAVAADTRSAMRRILKDAVPAGLAALETYYSVYSATQHDLAIAMANEFHLLQSGGSDYHGAIRPGILLGRGSGNLRIPVSVLDQLESAWKNQAK